jgi:Recombinase
LLTNPAYAGAYVFGRTRTEKYLDASGKVVSRDRMLPREEWEVLIPGHHPGYLDWDTWQDIQTRLRANFKPPRGDGGGAARQGAALLSGLVRCGPCGRMMQVGYSGHGGNAPGMCAAAAPSYTARRHARASAAPTCTALCWASCSRCWSRHR